MLMVSGAETWVEVEEAPMDHIDRALGRGQGGPQWKGGQGPRSHQRKLQLGHLEKSLSPQLSVSHTRWDGKEPLEFGCWGSPPHGGSCVRGVHSGQAGLGSNPSL